LPLHADFESLEIYTVIAPDLRGLGDSSKPPTGYDAYIYIIIKEAQERLGSKLRFVFRNFPVTKVRPHAYETALAAEAAGVLGDV